LPKRVPEFDFESALKELEGIVERMEKGELGLEEALKQFERGIELTRGCQKALTDAEQKVRILLDREGGEPETLPVNGD
jgi:exodeoxyribonuclease VII small subunit